MLSIEACSSTNGGFDMQFLTKLGVLVSASASPLTDTSIKRPLTGGQVSLTDTCEPETSILATTTNTPKVTVISESDQSASEDANNELQDTENSSVRGKCKLLVRI